MDLKKISLQWLQYHLISFIELVFAFHPFRWRNNTLPIICTPVSAFPTFLFSTVINAIIYLPLVIFIGNYINTNILITELFIISVFGLLFGTIFRAIQGKISYISINNAELKIMSYGFYEKEITLFKRNELAGIVLFKDKFKGTKNFKICIELFEKQQIMLELTMFEKKANKLMKYYCKTLNLKVVNGSKKEILNDGNFTISGSSQTDNKN